MAWKIGDRVMLNGGGPVMTVSAVNTQTGTVTCTWFVEATGQVSEREFHSDMLKPADGNAEFVSGVGHAFTDDDRDDGGWLHIRR